MIYSDKLWRPIETEDDGRLHRNICFGGGGGQQSYTQNNTQSSSDVGPNSAIFDALNGMAVDLSKYYQGHPNAPAWFPGGTLAKQSPQTAQAIAALGARGANGSPFETAATGNALDTLGGKYLDLSTNPYLQGAISYAQQPVIDAFNKQILPGVTGTFEGAGRTPQAGNLAGNAVQTATDTLTRNLAGAATQAGLSNYTTERGNQLTTMGMLPQFQGADYQNLMARLQSGGLLDQRAQQELDAENAKYSYEQTAQPDYITQMAQRLQTIVPGSHSTGSVNSSGYSYQPSTGGGWLGPALGAAGLGLKLGGILFPPASPLAAGAGMGLQAFTGSDRRDKTDIKSLNARDPLTGLPVYAYRYKGDPKTYPKVVGPMAQDAERAGYPVGHVGGHKVMALRRPMPAGGLM
jgi:hypothetical protein